MTPAKTETSVSLISAMFSVDRFELRDDSGLPTPPELIGPLIVVAILIGVFWRRTGRLRPTYTRPL